MMNYNRPIRYPPKDEVSFFWKALQHFQKLCQLLTDFLLVVLYCSWSRFFFSSLGITTFTSLYIGAISILIFSMVGLYRKERSIMNILETRKICRAILFIFLLLAAVFMRIPSLRTFYEILFFSAGIFLLIEIERLLFFKLDQLFLQKGLGWERVTIYSDGETGSSLARRMLNFPKFGKLPVGFLVDGEKQTEPGSEIPALWKISDNLDKTLSANRIDTVIVSNPKATERTIFLLQEACLRAGAKIEFDHYHNGLYLGPSRLRNASAGILLETILTKDRLFDRVFKRLLDVILSILLLILSFPVFIIVTIMVKRDSPGQVIFRQKRSGKDGKLFTMYKFRTMQREAKNYDYHPRSRDDRRITKLGRFLRKNSIDELPQLINVFKGEMSLVGPRPEMPFIVEKYRTIQKQRLTVKPGLTGLWQISADRSRPIHENIEYDLYYAQNHSPLLDIAIILRTFISIIRGLGAV